MRGSSWGIWLVVGAGLVACEPPALVDRGGECNSLSDCKPGLTCIEDRCSEDISSIVGTVPKFDGGVDAGK